MESLPAVVEWKRNLASQSLPTDISDLRPRFGHTMKICARIRQLGLLILISVLKIPLARNYSMQNIPTRGITDIEQVAFGARTKTMTTIDCHHGQEFIDACANVGGSLKTHGPIERMKRCGATEKTAGGKGGVQLGSTGICLQILAHIR